MRITYIYKTILHWNGYMADGNEEGIGEGSQNNWYEITTHKWSTNHKWK